MALNRRRGGRIRIGSSGLKLYYVEDVPRNGVGKDVGERAHSESLRRVCSSVVETEGRLTCDEVTEQVALR